MYDMYAQFTDTIINLLANLFCDNHVAGIIEILPHKIASVLHITLPYNFLHYFGAQIQNHAVPTSLLNFGTKLK